MKRIVLKEQIEEKIKGKVDPEHSRIGYPEGAKRSVKLEAERR